MNFLIVDDSETDRFMLEQSLREQANTGDESLNIDFAENADEAIKQVNLQHYSLILLDISMPGRDGFFVLETLRKLERGTYPHIFMLSSSSHDQDIEKAYRLLANGYLVKPDSLSAYGSLADTCLALAAQLQHPKTLH